jgi:hypothetical protein
MGSGHFLVFTLPLLVRLRMEEEKLSAQCAIISVLKENIQGLELDERCTQIAAFNVALTAWKLCGYQVLPTLHLACSGLAPSGTDAEWVALAGQDDRLRRGMIHLHSLFKEAPVLGSLVNPRAKGGSLIEAQFHELAPLLATALTASGKQKAKVEDDAVELGVIAQGLAMAAELLAGQFTVVVTNVPYLGRDRQEDALKGYCREVFSEAKEDLATCFLERCLAFCSPGGTSAMVTPQSWLYQSTFKKYRPLLLRAACMVVLAQLGPGAFRGISGEVVNVCLVTIDRTIPKMDQVVVGLDASEFGSPEDKDLGLQTLALVRVSQRSLLNNPQTKISLDSLEGKVLLSTFASCYNGIQNWRLWPLWSSVLGSAKTKRRMESTAFHGRRDLSLRRNGSNSSLGRWKRTIRFFSDGPSWRKRDLSMAQRPGGLES